MAVVFDKIKAGDVLYDVHREKLGNTTMSRWGVWEVRVIMVDHALRKATCSWNGNPPETWGARRLSKLHRTVPKAAREQEERRRQRGGLF